MLPTNNISNNAWLRYTKCRLSSGWKDLKECSAILLAKHMRFIGV